MSRRCALTRVLCALVVLLALGGRTAAGVPLSALAELRAAACCASSECPAPRLPSQCPCCALRSADDVALQRPLPPELGRVADVLHGIGPTPAAARIGAAPGGGAPDRGVAIYLRLRTLRC
jgi:hypothetical protein